MMAAWSAFSSSSAVAAPLPRQPARPALLHHHPSTARREVEAAKLTVALMMTGAACWVSIADPTSYRVGSASLADGWGCGSVGSVVISSLSCPEVAFRSEGSGWALAEAVG